MKKYTYYVEKYEASDMVRIKGKGWEGSVSIHKNALFDTMKEYTEICKREGYEAVFIVRGV